MRYFFYGSLMDADVRAAVLGRAPVCVEPATLIGWRRVKAAGASYPLLVEARLAAVAGAALDLSPADASRVAWYEGKDDYEPRELSVTLGSGRQANALVFLPRGGVAHDGEPWEPEVWARDDKPAVLDAARGWMAMRPGA